MVKRGRKGTILIENVIFIILNVVFLSIIILFLSNQMSGVHVLDEVYAKKIALVTDYAKPDMIIKIDMSKALKYSEKNKINFADVVKVTGNVVNVNLKAGDSKDSGYSYSFFNNVLLCPYPDKDAKTNTYTGMYVFTVSKNEGGKTCSG